MGSTPCPQSYPRDRTEEYTRHIIQSAALLTWERGRLTRVAQRTWRREPAFRLQAEIWHQEEEDSSAGACSCPAPDRQGCWSPDRQPSRGHPSPRFRGSWSSKPAIPKGGIHHIWWKISRKRNEIREHPQEKIHKFVHIAKNWKIHCFRNFRQSSRHVFFVVLDYLRRGESGSRRCGGHGEELPVRRRGQR